MINSAMTRNLESCLVYEAKKHQYIADLVDNIDTLTDTDIENAQVKPWIKKALRKHKSSFVPVFTLDETRVRTGVVPDPMGKMFTWNVLEHIPIRNGSLEVTSGQLVWIPDTEDGIWFDTIFIPLVHSLNCTFVKNCSKLEYKRAVRSRANGLVADTSIDISPPSAQSSIPGVSFF